MSECLHTERERESDPFLGGWGHAAAPALAALEEIGKRPCEASDWYDIPEDGVSRCLDPEFNDMTGDPVLTLCPPCRARAAIAQAKGSGEGASVDAPSGDARTGPPPSNIAEVSVDE